MVISSIEINNFKGFRASGKIVLTEGFNVVVGQNNVGKTALLEALTLQVSNKPHRSSETIPYQGAPHSNASTFELTFAVEGNELASLLKGFNSFWLPTRYVGNSALGLLNETLASKQSLHCSIKENKFVTANFDCDFHYPNAGLESVRFWVFFMW